VCARHTATHPARTQHTHNIRTQHTQHTHTASTARLWYGQRTDKSVVWPKTGVLHQIQVIWRRGIEIMGEFHAVPIPFSTQLRQRLSSKLISAEPLKLVLALISTVTAYQQLQGTHRLRQQCLTESHNMQSLRSVRVPWFCLLRQ